MSSKPFLKKALKKEKKASLDLAKAQLFLSLFLSSVGARGPSNLPLLSPLAQHAQQARLPLSAQWPAQSRAALPRVTDRPKPVLLPSRTLPSAHTPACSTRQRSVPPLSPAADIWDPLVRDTLIFYLTSWPNRPLSREAAPSNPVFHGISCL